MKRFNTKYVEYRRLKYNWKHLQKNYEDLSDTALRPLRKWTSSRKLIEQLINYSLVVYHGCKSYNYQAVISGTKTLNHFSFWLSHSIQRYYLKHSVRNINFYCEKGIH